VEKRRMYVTGLGGMMGKALTDVVSEEEFRIIGPRGRSDVYPYTGKKFDLRDSNCPGLYSIGYFKPHYVVHLAAKVGGIQANMSEMGDFYYDNTMINTNVLESCRLYKVKKMVSLLSTCIYPDKVNYPLTEDQIHNGEPHHSNFGYAYAKRMLDVESRAYRQQYSCNYICAVPNNLYGENDNYDLENSHVIPALTRKIWEAKINNTPHIEVWGDGSPLREFTYSGDIAKILLFLLENYNEPEPINIGNTEEYSISGVVEMLCRILQYDGEIIWNKNMPNGQQRKPSNNKKLLDIGWKKEYYTPIEEGLRNVCKWFVESYPDIRI